MAAFPESEYAARRDRFAACIADAGLDAAFLAPSSDLEYLTGLGRDPEGGGRNLGRFGDDLLPG